MSSSFHWTDCAATLRRLDSECPLALEEPKGRWFENERLRVRPPLVFPIAATHRSLADYLADLPQVPGRHCVLVLQAGVVAMGRFEGARQLATKRLSRYVVRGKGRAQPLHLKTRGKSRYGSRLRLANARRLLEEINEKLIAWDAEFGAAERVYYSCPVRLWADLFESTPPPPFDRELAVRIPRDLPKPTVEVLRRAARSLEYGRIEENAGG